MKKSVFHNTNRADREYEMQNSADLEMFQYIHTAVAELSDKLLHSVSYHELMMNMNRLNDLYQTIDDMMAPAKYPYKLNIFNIFISEDGTCTQYHKCPFEYCNSCANCDKCIIVEFPPPPPYVDDSELPLVDNNKAHITAIKRRSASRQVICFGKYYPANMRNARFNDNPFGPLS